MEASPMSPDKTDYCPPPTPSEIITEARQWLRTPYQHQAMLKGVGCDCVGLVTGVGLATRATLITRQQIKAYSGYGRLPNPRTMHHILKTHLKPLPEDSVQVGDIAWIQWRQGLPMHLVIIAELDNGQRTIIHSTAEVGRVVEHSLTPAWNDRIVSFWRYPEVTQWQQ